MPLSREAGSFRDPSGFVYYRDGVLLRQVNRSYREDYRQLMDSGLYEELASSRLLISHEERDLDERATDEAYAVLRPQVVPFISYPYEWSFSQLKDAALVTLDVLKRALKKGMVLKDASAFNVQFLDGRPVFIDTLSFEQHISGAPWIAYRQFCQHFLAPLVLTATVDARFGRMSRRFTDGVPLDLAASLAPRRTRWNLGLAMHLHAHARSRAIHAYMAPEAGKGRVSDAGMMGLVENLESTVRGLKMRVRKSVWSHYYKETNYSDAAMTRKREIVAGMLTLVEPSPSLAWDLGANTGEFSQILAERGIYTVAWDLDPTVVEKHYLALRESGNSKILPLIQDLTNPSPSIGWGLEERKSFTERGPADVILALALVHHLAIGNNVPLESVAELFARVGKWAIVEFVPKEDSQTKRLLATRKDIFPNYTQEGFERAFSQEFDMARKAPIAESLRTLYLFKRKGTSPPRLGGSGTLLARFGAWRSW